MGHQFVMGRTIDEALDRSAKKEHAVYRYSYDMLGESALTSATAERYQQDYRDAIAAIGRRGPFANHTDAPSISVKLSALHPAYEVARRERARRELTAKLLELAQLAMKYGIALSVDAEEADRLELSLDIIGDVFGHPSLQGWNGLGIVVQAYAKRTPFVIDWLIETAPRRQPPLVRAPGQGRLLGRRDQARAGKTALPGYPVFTRKPNTDGVLPGLRAAAVRRRQRPDLPAVRHPQRAHIAAIHHLAQGRPYENQRLHGYGHRPLRRSDRPAKLERALPRLRAGGHARGPAAVSGAPPARERRQHQLRQPAWSTRAYRCASWSPIRARRFGRSRRSRHPRIRLPVNLYAENAALAPHSNAISRKNSMASTLPTTTNSRPWPRP